jgi:hypothetical protein
MNPDGALQLIVQTDFAVGLVLAARKLDAVHAEVRMPPAGLRDILGVDLRQRDERAAIVWPTDLLGKLRDLRFVRSHIRAADEFWHCRQSA